MLTKCNSSKEIYCNKRKKMSTNDRKVIECKESAVFYIIDEIHIYYLLLT